MDKSKKITIGLYALSIFLILGISYAYFSLNIIGNEDAKLSVISAGTLELTFTDGNDEIILENAVPGDYFQKEITVKNTGTLNATYNLVWNELHNTFINDEIIMFAECVRLNSEGVEEGTCNNIDDTPVSKNIIKKNISIEPGVTHKYTFAVGFIETGESQNYNQGKIFGGRISIEESNKIAGTLKNNFFEESGMSDRSLVKSLSFYSDNRVIDGAQSYDVSEEQDESVIMYVEQNSENNSLYDLSIVANGIIAFPEDSSYLLSFNTFINCGGLNRYKTMLTDLNFNNSINTSNVINMRGMLRGLEVVNIDLSKFNTSNVIDMSSMFDGNQATILDVSNFDTSNVTNMNSMFENTKATALDLSNFDTSKVTNMASMFSYSKATVLDISSFNTSNVTNMVYMFYGSQATTLDLSNFDTSNVTSMMSMFNFSQATSLDLSNFDTSNVTSMMSMFRNSQATMIDVSSFDTSNVTHMNDMFQGSQATTLDLSNFDTSNVLFMNTMFSSSKNLKAIYVSNKFNTDAVTGSDNMFTNCTSLVGGAGTVYDSTKVDKTYARIDGGTSNPGYFTRK